MWTNARSANGIKHSPKCQNTVDFAPFPCTQTNRIRWHCNNTFLCILQHLKTSNELLFCVSFSVRAWRESFEFMNKKICFSKEPKEAAKFNTKSGKASIRSGEPETERTVTAQQNIGRKPQQISLFSIHLLFPMFLFLLIYSIHLKLRTRHHFLQ